MVQLHINQDSRPNYVIELLVPSDRDAELGLPWTSQRVNALRISNIYHLANLSHINYDIKFSAANEMMANQLSRVHVVKESLFSTWYLVKQPESFILYINEKLQVNATLRGQ